jgi:prepilin-type N-terminal cleavage/methylation domain-containing protein
MIYPNMQAARSVMASRKRQQGVTLIELMIGMVVGLIVLSGVIYMFIVIASSSRDVLNSARLNNDLSTTVGLMVSEVRRAGHWIQSGGATTNPYSVDVGLDVNVVGTDCILYSYDFDGDGAVSTTERSGFKLQTMSGVPSILRKKSGPNNSDCSGANDGDWETFTDERFMNVTSFVIADNTVCLVDTVATSGAACSGAASGTEVAAVREIVFTLSAEVIRDTAWSKTITDRVRIRNDLLVDSVP